MTIRPTSQSIMYDDKQEDKINGLAVFIFLFLLFVSAGITTWMALAGAPVAWILGEAIALNLIGVYILLAFKVAEQWEKAIVLRLGRYIGLKGPGPFWIIPIVDTIPAWIDHRVMVASFTAERTLTKDTVPVDVDAVLFWMVWDAEKAALEVEDYRAAIAWAAQTALREIIGQMELADILVGRAKMDAELQHIIDERTTPWGVTVQSVEIRDIVIPSGLEDAMAARPRPNGNARPGSSLARARNRLPTPLLKPPLPTAKIPPPYTCEP